MAKSQYPLLLCDNTYYVFQVHTVVSAPSVNTKRQATATGKAIKVEKPSKPNIEDFPDIEVIPNTMATGKICRTTL